MSLNNNPFSTASTNIYKILETGIVVQIDKTGKTFSKYSPIGSCKIRLTGDKTVKSDSIGYYVPLFPPNMVIMPSEGEEVYLLFTGANRSGVGYWLSRRSTSEDFLEYGDAYKNAPSEEMQYGAAKPQIAKRDNTKIDNQFKRSYQSGDVFIVGNAGNGLLLSYNSANGGMVTDLLSSVSNEKVDGIYKKLDGSPRLTFASKNNLDKTFEAPITDKKEKNTAYLTSDNIRLWSPESKDPLNPAVLGDKQEEWFKSVIELLIDLVDKLATQANDLSTHTHTNGGGVTTPPSNFAKFTELQTKLNKLKDDINSQTETIKDHHSNNIFIN